MLYFSRWKHTMVIGVCLLAILLAAPNLFTDKELDGFPSWLPKQTVHLGLDLQGGSQLLLEVNSKVYYRDQYASFENQIRSSLRDKKIGYVGLSSSGSAVNFSVRKSEDAAEAKKAVRKVDRDADIAIEGDRFSVTYGEQQLHRMLDHVVGQSIEIVRRRIDETGTKEPIIQRQGSQRILLQVPGLDNPEQLKQLLGKTAKLTFHLMDESASLEKAVQTGVAPVGSLLLEGEGRDGQISYHLIKKKAMLTGDMLEDAQATFVNGRPVVSFRFNTFGGKQFGAITKQNIGKPFAVVLDNKVISAPVIQEPILGGSGIIQGNFNVQTANELAMLLRAGALPVPLAILEERTVGPSLGEDSIEAGKLAGLVGVCLVVGFMLLSYGTFGLLATCALAIYMTLILAMLSLFQATLTMPGIAGIVLTIGMAVDANVLIFERIREEVRAGAAPSTAIERGFRHAFSAIFDSNITTLIVALLLYMYGSGPVRGFAVTLAIGIVSSMFSAITMTRYFIVLWFRQRKPQELRI